jgi:hypothetical protein
MLAPASTSASPVFYALGGDANGVPRTIYQIDSQFDFVGDLADGSLGFSGLASSPSGLASIGGDGFSFTNLYTFAPGGSPVSSFSVPYGLGTGGLAWSSTAQAWYAIENAITGAELWQINPNGSTAQLFNLGTAGGGGLTVLADGSVYAMLFDNNYDFTFTQLNLGTQTVTNYAVGFSAAMNGGLAYDPSNFTFYGVGNDNQFNSTLYSWQAFSLNASALTPTAVGVGFSGLVLADTSVPEPSLALPVLAGIGFLLRRSRKAQSSQTL